MKNIALLFIITFLFNTAKSSQVPTLSPKQNLADTIRTQDYTIFNKSDGIESIEIIKDKKPGNILYIKLGNRKFDGSNNNGTSLGIAGKSKSRESQQVTGPVFDHIEILSGGYEKIKAEKISTTQNLFTLENLTFPLKLKMQAGKEFIEFELLEAGEWTMDVKYKK